MDVLNILFYSFLLIFCIQLCYYGVLFSKFAFSKQSKPSIKNIGISVLVCAKNEAENLKAHIPEIIAQDYSKFELILINDGSTDDTLEVMKGFEADFKNVSVVDVKPNEAFWGNKKYPLTLGIKSASYDFLLFTDADCRPLTNQWIKEMSRHFSNDHSIIIGYGAYKKVKGSLLNLLIRFETIFSAIQYFSYAKWGMPYMAVGRNLAYRKEEFFNAKGFTSHMHLTSGDDDLFINQVANASNTATCFDKNGFTESIAESTFRGWIRQKRRHVSTANYYKGSHKFLLATFYLTQLLFWVIGITLLLLSFKPWVIGSIVAFRVFLFLLIYGLSAKKLNDLSTLLFSPFIELFLILLQLIIFISNLTSKKHHWR